jgi:hypothetical protein
MEKTRNEIFFLYKIKIFFFLITPLCCCCCRATTAIVPSTRFSPIISGLAGIILTATGFFFRLSIVVSNSTTSIQIEKLNLIEK